MTELYSSGFIHCPSPLIVGQSGVGDHPCQDVDGQKPLFSMKGFPGAVFVEKPIEETRWFFCNGILLSAARFSGCKAVEKSVCDRACV